MIQLLPRPKNSSLTRVRCPSEWVPMVLWAYIQPEKSERNLTINPCSKRFCSKVRTSRVCSRWTRGESKNKQTNKQQQQQQKKQTESKVTLWIFFVPDPIFAWPERWVFVEERLLLIKVCYSSYLTIKHRAPCFKLFADEAQQRRSTVCRNKARKTLRFSSWISNELPQ